MAPVALALILGWCLVAASRAWHMPRPSLWLHPSQGVSVGDTVTLRCHLPRPATWVWLYQDGGWTYSKYKDKENNTAEFSFFKTKWEHTGMYRCQYRVLVPFGTSETSDPVELVVTDHRYSPPGISLSPEELTGTGTNFTVRMETATNVTILCWNMGYAGTILLHKRGHSAPVQRQDYSGVGMATFSLFAVTLSDSGTSGCSYRPKSYPFVSSALGDRMTLEVTPAAAPPGAERDSPGNLVVLVVRGCAAAFVFILGLYFVLDARSFMVCRDE
ncbi:T-cell-interacting, activating receptor on myeloid cells protein 1-like [Numida meleagris]|uniref:T-cell-interacting, activating receptor on myeloid cells protein 1-like n=1 Tax=Numida meleagris TaxID=8996 RepID=UPI000B3DD242|nr:T-cell-interacting, activating receptor on myeloid cells protein 1-like [Numida meleagris]